MFFKGTYLRVLKPRTTNGVNVKIGPDQRIEFKEVHLPYTAKKNLEIKNAKKPDHLKMIIEVVSDELHPLPAVEEPRRNKPGPKPRG
jgi:hypothetical protein